MNDFSASSVNRVPDHGGNAPPSFHIAFCVDSTYFRAMGGTIASILSHNPGQHFTFHVLALNASAENLKRLTRIEQQGNVTVKFHRMDRNDFGQFESLLKSSYYTLSIFFRLVIPRLLQNETEKVLYLDADMLCVRSLDKLIYMDISRDIVAVAPDHPETTRKRTQALNLTHQRYFNSGMLYINIPRWIEQRVTEQSIDVLILRKHELRFVDQDALNIVLDGKARYISRNFNFLYDMVHDLKNNSPAMRPVGNAVILHFAGPIKPWTTWVDHEANKLFRVAHAMSPWSDVELDRTPTNTNEMRIFSRFLYLQGQPLKSIMWYFRYLVAHSRKTLQSLRPKTVDGT